MFVKCAVAFLMSMNIDTWLNCYWGLADVVHLRISWQFRTIDWCLAKQGQSQHLCFMHFGYSALWMAHRRTPFHVLLSLRVHWRLAYAMVWTEIAWKNVLKCQRLMHPLGTPAVALANADMDIDTVVSVSPIQTSPKQPWPNFLLSCSVSRAISQASRPKPSVWGVAFGQALVK